MTSRPITARQLAAAAQRAGRSIYAQIYVAGSFRARREPRVRRKYRPKMISWAGPAAFYRNRFYEQDKWYKARIQKPLYDPGLHLIHADDFTQSLTERLAGWHDVTEAERLAYKSAINVGFKFTPSKIGRTALIKDRTEQDWDQLASLARRQLLSIDLREFEAESLAASWPIIAKRMGDHSHIFRDTLHEDAYFYPVLPMRVAYQIPDECELELPVYLGNRMQPSEMGSAPSVHWQAADSTHWTLMALSPDSNPYEEKGNVLHWMVSNIPGSDLSQGDVLCPYLQPVPFKGSGAHRLIFMLFHQTHGRIELTAHKRNEQQSDSLCGRVFDSQAFYKQNEELLTPASFVFAQTEWDTSVQHTLHNTLDMEQPIYEFEFPAPEHAPQEEFPRQSVAFNHYLDRYRDPVEVDTELLKARLARVRVTGDEPKPTYADIDHYALKHSLATWQHVQQRKINIGLGKWKALYENRIQ